MKSNGKRYKSLCYLVLMVFLCVFLVGCSTTGEFFSRMKFWDESQHTAGLNENNVKNFVSTVRSSPGNPDSHYLLGKYYQARGMHKQAIVEFKKTVSIDPLHVKAYNRIGVAFDKRGYTVNAVEYFQKALELDPEIDYVLNNLGYAYIRLGEYESAIVALNKAIKLNDQNKHFHNNLGLAYAWNEQYDEALIEFRLAGGEARADYNIALVYYKQGLHNKARSHFLNAAIIDPSFVEAREWFELADSMITINPSSIEKTERPVVEKVVIKETQEVPVIENSPSLKEMQSIVSYKDIGIEISNGNGVRRMAKRVGNYLNKKGFDVVRLTNADNYRHEKTIVYYRDGHLKTANEIIKEIPGSYNLDMVYKFDRSNVDVKVLIGGDIVKHNKLFIGG